MHTVRVALILMVQIAITITNKIYILPPLQRIEKSVDNQKIHVALTPLRFTIVKCMLHSC